MGLEASELARWTRFAGKGGIGKCTATCDCVAESTDDLMFLKVFFFADFFFAIDGLYVWIQDDEITVLLQLPDRENIFLVCISCFLDVYVVEYSLRATVRVSSAISLVLTYIFMPS
jgi:hypothetical protein